MIGDVLVLLKNQLNAYLQASTADKPKVVLVDGDPLDSISFKSDAVTLLLVNLEEDTTLRQAQPFKRDLVDGTTLKVLPEIRLYLYVLFVARFKEYEIGLRYLSLILQFFQSHRVFDARSAPELNDRIEKLQVELVTLPFSEQNEIWNALRTAYQPSVLYRIGMVTFRDDEGILLPEIAEAVVTVNR